MTTDIHDSVHRRGVPDGVWYAGVAAAAVLWWLVYGQLIPFSEWVTSLFPVARKTQPA